MSSENIKVCSYEKFGICNRRATCDLFHPTENCSDVNCSIINCRRRHPQPCKFFGTPQGCSFGSSCKYSHNPIEKCLDDDCMGVNCNKRHPEPCKFFGTKQGCSFGSSCIFDHRVQFNRRPSVMELLHEDMMLKYSYKPVSRPPFKRIFYDKSTTKIFNEDLPMEILQMIFDDKLLDYEDILECRLVSRYLQ